MLESAAPVMLLLWWAGWTVRYGTVQDCMYRPVQCLSYSGCWMRPAVVWSRIRTTVPYSIVVAELSSCRCFAAAVSSVLCCTRDVRYYPQVLDAQTCSTSRYRCPYLYYSLADLVQTEQLAVIAQEVSFAASVLFCTTTQPWASPGALALCLSGQSEHTIHHPFRCTRACRTAHRVPIRRGNMTQAGGLQSRRPGLRWMVQARRRSAPLPAAKKTRRRHFDTM